MNLKKPEFWLNKNFTSLILLPLTIVTYLVNFFKKFSYKKKFKIKSICIGNIYIGGTGKTPLSIMISDILNTKKKKVAVVKKFYLNQLDEQRLIKKYSSLIISKNRTSKISTSHIMVCC